MLCELLVSEFLCVLNTLANATITFVAHSTVQIEIFVRGFLTTFFNCRTSEEKKKRKKLSNKVVHRLIDSKI